MNSHPPDRLLTRIRITAFLLLGYTAFFPYLFYFADLHWMRLYQNEAYLWGLLFDIFNILVVILAVLHFRQGKIFSSIAICLAILPIIWSVYPTIKFGVGPSSNEDTDFKDGLIDFWFGGGAALALLFDFVVCGVYFFFRRKSLQTRRKEL